MWPKGWPISFKHILTMKNKRKIYWPGVAIYFNISKILYKRNNKLWVFGALRGRKYDDNARYLFEYVKKYHADTIHSVWLADDEKAVNDALRAGGEAYTISSKQGKKIARKAGVAVFTHTLEDFGITPQIGGAKLVFLGHGVGFKQTFNAKRHGLALFLKKTLDKFFSWIQRDITISTSVFNKSERIKIAGIKDESKVFITGQPRNDSLKYPT